MGRLFDKIRGIKARMKREDLIVARIILSPVIITIVLSVIGDIDARKTRLRLESRPATTWMEILTPEERKEYGLDRYDEMEQRLKSDGHGKPSRQTDGSSKTETDFDKEDFYDIVDRNGGLDGEYSDIDYHDIEDTYGD